MFKNPNFKTLTPYLQTLLKRCKNRDEEMLELRQNRFTNRAISHFYGLTDGRISQIFTELDKKQRKK